MLLKSRAWVSHLMHDHYEPTMKRKAPPKSTLLPSKEEYGTLEETANGSGVDEDVKQLPKKKGKTSKSTCEPYSKAIPCEMHPASMPASDWL